LENRIPKAINNELGYEPSEVVQLLANANDWQSLSNQKMSLVVGGLDIETTDRVIDAAIDYLQLNGEVTTDLEPEALQDMLAGVLAEKPGGRFPLVGAFEKGYDVKTVDSLLLMVEHELFGGDQVDTKLLRPGFMPKVRMGYLTSSVDEVFETLAIGIIAGRN